MIQFGTDGWRAVISEEFTFDNVRKVTQAIADQVLARNPNPTDRLSMVVGFDTRFLSDRYAIAVAEVFAGNGIHVWLTKGDAPTPMVSFAIVDRKAAGGVMITASHNPPRYNGIKLKAAYGGSASPDDAKDVERRIRLNEDMGRPPNAMNYHLALEQGLIERFAPLPAYREHIQGLVDLDVIRREGIGVAVDAMYGAGRVYLRRLLEEADCRVTELRGEMNPGFNGIHPEPIARHLQPLMAELATGHYRLGLATDGDGDRIGAMDPDGRFIDPHCIMALILDFLVEERGLRGSVVKTVSTTQMLNRLAEHHQLTLHETPVGFNHISDRMLEERVLIGGEESGGISILGHIPEGDGLLIGLLLTEMVARRGKSLGQQVDELMNCPYVGHFRYARHDRAVRPFDKQALLSALADDRPDTLAGQRLLHLNDRDGVKLIFEDQSWLLIRPSGTEPVLRIYAEAGSDEQVHTLLEAGGEMAERRLAQIQPATTTL